MQEIAIIVACSNKTLRAFTIPVLTMLRPMPAPTKIGIAALHNGASLQGRLWMGLALASVAARGKGSRNGAAAKATARAANGSH